MWIYLEAYDSNPNNVLKSPLVLFFQKWFFFFFSEWKLIKKGSEYLQMFTTFLLLIAKIMFNFTKF